eukprot:g4842.t1
MAYAKSSKPRDNDIVPENDENLPVSLQYHKYLDKSFANEEQCPPPTYIGYFPFAFDVTITTPSPSSIVSPTFDLRTYLQFEFSALNFWVLDYLPNLCDDMKLVYRLDEDIMFQSKICDLVKNPSEALKNGNFLFHKSRGLELSIGYHILRMAPIYIPPSNANDNNNNIKKYFSTETWFGRQSKTSFWFGWNQFTHSSQAVENYFNLNPGDLYDYSRLKKAHGWDGLSSYARSSANNMLSKFEYLGKDSSGFPWKEQNWTYDTEPSRDPHYYLQYPVQVNQHCNHFRPNVVSSGNTTMAETTARYIKFRPPSGGLNNQIKEVIQFIAISHVLNRTLILPRLSLDNPQLYQWGVEHAIKFEKLFNIEQMRFNLMGITCFISEDDFEKLSIKPINAHNEVVYRAPHSREAPLDWYRREYGYLRKHWPVLEIACPDGLSHYLVKFLGPRALNLQNRIRNALVFEETLVKASNFVVRNLLTIANQHGQNGYVALHARVENDWKEHSIHMERLWGFEVEMWTPPRLILKRMSQVEMFQNTKIIYLSVNIGTYDENETGNLFQIFGYTMDDGQAHYLPYKLNNFTDIYNVSKMPYLLRSAVDYIVCTKSTAFVGNGFSTFSQLVSRSHANFHRPSFVYNIRNSDRVHLRTDHGLLLEPLSAVELDKKDLSFLIPSKEAMSTSLSNQTDPSTKYLVNAEKKHIKYLSDVLLSTSNNGPVSASEIFYYKPWFMTKGYDPWPFYVGSIHVEHMQIRRTLYIFEKTNVFIETTTFCNRHFHTNADNVKSCEEYFFKVANEKIQEFQLNVNVKLCSKLRSGPQKPGDMLRTLKEIGTEERNDKIMDHHYDEVYSFLFKDLRNKKIKVLEIGTSQSSMSLWQRYFPYAEIYGVDLGIWTGCGLKDNSINNKFGCKYSNRVRLFQGDILDQTFLDELIETVGEVDIIIDDGAHTPEHSIVPFFILLKRLLKPGGIYTIEDIETNYWNTGYSTLYGNKINAGKGTADSLIEWFKDMIDTVNRHFFNPKYYTLNKLEHMIESLHFSHNILIAKKGHLGEASFKTAKYRYSDYVKRYGNDDEYISIANTNKLLDVLEQYV